MTKIPSTDILREEAALIGASLNMQRQGLDLLLAEMRVFAALVPVQTEPARTAAEADAAIEAGFDNMPV